MNKLLRQVNQLVVPGDSAEQQARRIYWMQHCQARAKAVQGFEKTRKELLVDLKQNSEYTEKEVRKRSSHEYSRAVIDWDKKHTFNGWGK